MVAMVVVFVAMVVEVVVMVVVVLGNGCCLVAMLLLGDVRLTGKLGNCLYVLICEKNEICYTLYIIKVTLNILLVGFTLFFILKIHLKKVPY